MGFFGFKHDRKLALQALAVSAAKKDVHSVFAGWVSRRSGPHSFIHFVFQTSLVLMTYHGVVLLLSGYQADEAHIIKQYKAIVDKCVPIPLPVTRRIQTKPSQHRVPIPNRRVMDTEPRQYHSTAPVLEITPR